ncbi:alpha/beta hydrolase fold [Gluconacetobacter diazotrophicus PA1 5]|uniref:Alpha/beta fold hydrolase n=2 Tax=Gluconacetobacter diazotrophicus TaxID=33996 RepID=A0A7W4FCX3_GLUDI|nr:alpha/beta fold hydrolase [Gluconacetobacter diazotrophicus]ACI52796.1 alpha/beta hydrolase fold [Gluconacetobacter diazotrophicus PA1 5]MBB2155466.1 alpha/beta fold hydrolase [Gluconacetobacter diazotrophicus]TWB09059.1 polyhydroxyalkanoate synthase [Gluconacetobacter diazotrophicus]
MATPTPAPPHGPSLGPSLGPSPDQSPGEQPPHTVAPGPMLRRGPRPLALHLSGALTSMPFARSSTGSNDGSTSSKTGFPLPPGLPGGDPAALDPVFLAGVAAYRRHPYQRVDPAPPPVLWAQGDMRVLDYAPTGGRPVLFVPSLINRAYVLDLMPGPAAGGVSILRDLAARGLRPLLVDWGWPGEAERRLDCAGYVTERLEPALAAIAAQCGGPVTLAGYCMGGLLAVAAAQRRPGLVRALALLATPWDFSTLPPGTAGALAHIIAPYAGLMALTGTVPVDALQTAFAAIDPPGIIRKFRRFADMAPDDPRTALFAAMEDWLGDGVPLAAPAAIACLRDWYGANQPMRECWQVGGTTIRPSTLALPTLVAIPERDRIVPPESARPLAAQIPHATELPVAGGHVGMVAGPRARDLLGAPLAAWLLRHG